MLLDGKSTERVTMEYTEGRGPLVVINDRNEKPRAVLGILSKTNLATGETTLYPESTMTLLDAKGKFLVQLPK